MAHVNTHLTRFWKKFCISFNIRSLFRRKRKDTIDPITFDRYIREALEYIRQHGIS